MEKIIELSLQNLNTGNLWVAFLALAIFYILKKEPFKIYEYLSQKRDNEHNFAKELLESEKLTKEGNDFLREHLERSAFKRYYGINADNEMRSALIKFHKKDTIVKTKKIVEKPAINIEDERIKIEHLDELVPIDTVDSKNKDVFKKYGLEFNGNCYACDLALLSITKKSIKLTNVCDSKVNEIYNIVKFSVFDYRIEISTAQNDFLLTKIDNAPVYELKIIGNDIRIENLRVSRFFTLKKILDKFKQHDCGDFEG